MCALDSSISRSKIDKARYLDYDKNFKLHKTLDNKRKVHIQIRQEHFKYARNLRAFGRRSSGQLAIE